jgi:hypothetical protein
MRCDDICELPSYKYNTLSREAARLTFVSGDSRRDTGMRGHGEADARKSGEGGTRPGTQGKEAAVHACDWQSLGASMAVRQDEAGTARRETVNKGGRTCSVCT